MTPAWSSPGRLIILGVARTATERCQKPTSPMADARHRLERMRGFIGASAFATALILIAWLPLGVLDIVPFVLSIPGMGPLRAHAGAAIACLLVAALGFWRS